MSIQDTITLLKSIAVIDSRITELEAELARERTGIGEKSELKGILDHRIERLSASAAEMETTRNTLVGEMRQTSLQVDRSREKLMRCRNEREANAVQREQEELRRVFREREHETQKLAGLIDAARLDLTQATEERDALVQELDAMGGDATRKIHELETALATEKLKRDEGLKGGDRALFRRYDVVRQRRGTGLAIADDGMCVSCHISLPPMLYQRILHQVELYQCPSCQRFLYPRALEVLLEGEPTAENHTEATESDDSDSLE